MRCKLHSVQRQKLKVLTKHKIFNIVAIVSVICMAFVFAHSKLEKYLLLILLKLIVEF